MENVVILQEEKNDCGCACIAMILKYYNKNISLDVIKKKVEITENGLSVFSIVQFFKNRNWGVIPLKISYADFKNIFSVPCIVYLRSGNWNHYVVLFEQCESGFRAGNPALGEEFIPDNQLEAFWGFCVVYIVANSNSKKYKF